MKPAMAYPAELLRHQVIAVAASGLLALLGAGVALGAWWAGAALGFAGAGAAAFAIGLWMACLTLAWYRRAWQVVNAVPAWPATATLVAERGMDSTTLYVAVDDPRGGGRQPHRVALLVPPWDCAALLAAPAEVHLFIDPQNARLVAVATDRGMLWCLPHNVPGPVPG